MFSNSEGHCGNSPGDAVADGAAAASATGGVVGADAPGASPVDGAGVGTAGPSRYAAIRVIGPPAFPSNRTRTRTGHRAPSAFFGVASPRTAFGSPGAGESSSLPSCCSTTETFAASGGSKSHSTSRAAPVPGLFETTIRAPFGTFATARRVVPSSDSTVPRCPRIPNRSSMLAAGSSATWRLCAVA